MDNSECSKKKVSIGGKLQKLSDFQVLQLDKLILVEGQDEVYFFNELLKYMRITDIEIREVGGKNNFRDTLASFKSSFLEKKNFFDKLKTLAFISDANNDGAENAFQSIKNDIRAVMGQNIILPPEMKQFTNMNPRIGIFIMPNNHDQGALEDLCLKTIENDPVNPYIENFIQQISRLEIKPKNISKAKVQIFLATRKYPVNSLGIGARKKYWNFDSPVLNELKEFIKEM